MYAIMSINVIFEKRRFRIGEGAVVSQWPDPPTPQQHEIELDRQLGCSESSPDGWPYRGGGLGVKREPAELLSKDPIRRPTDILIIPTPMCRQSTWQLFDRVAIDFAVVSPFHLGMGSRSSMDQYAQHKRQDRFTLERCNEQGIGFEPIIFDYMGRVNAEVDHLLDSFCRTIDGSLERFSGSTTSRLHERISFTLQCGAYNVAERTTNTPPGNASASFQTFISDLAIVLSGNPPTQDGLIWIVYLR